ncbi:MAG: hypothetical protein OXF05_05590 [Hyphomicrobiales bacterium]|nr:hypothetical protein [Hyphomicrobiales bacterium]MCY4032479.1 hypothetical protein [Hyphomicrobiales bacterium]MCY4038823.1 hypothetical protein [Hyphomicrobiales bacterium]
MSRWQIIGATAGAIVAVFSIMATIIGATWILSEKINEVRVELHIEIAEVREEIGKVREDMAKGEGKIREDISNLRGDVVNIGTKLEEFKESHRREHDIFYNASAKNDEENSSSAN